MSLSRRGFVKLFGLGAAVAVVGVKVNVDKNPLLELKGKVLPLPAGGRDARSWSDISGKPSLFEPSPHTHALDDIYGSEYVVGTLNDIASSL